MNNDPNKIPPTEYHYDVLVIGAGHAGTEAALAAARVGAKTALLTTNLDTVGQMSCNPAIGGVGKGQIVREIDALGGVMGEAIDATGLQFRLLNRRKGPAMHSPRAQADKKAYQNYVKHYVERQANLHLRQEMIEDFIIEKMVVGKIIAGKQPEDRYQITGVIAQGGSIYRAKAVILTTGTFLSAQMHTGEVKTSGGRAGEGTSASISNALAEMNFQIARFKTGTPPRINGRSINFDLAEIQPGDETPQPFSFLTESIKIEQMPCWIAYTNEAVHNLIRENLERAPMYTGQIDSKGPRYCPSIEDKVVRFADKDRHQLFLEPEGWETQEYYINGISTSLPRDVQDKMFQLIPALKDAQIMRYGYAVEYDYCPPDQLRPTLETKKVEGLYFAGQINGTTGYEEAGAQGLIAGANAALKLAGKGPLILGREQAYIGVLIDDLVTSSVDEPYRMFTSRAEYRLMLRQDNADRRLTELGYQMGLVSQARYQRLKAKEQAIVAVTDAIGAVRFDSNQTLEKLLRRPESTWADVLTHLPDLKSTSLEVQEQVVYDIKYAGYISRQEVEISRQKRLAEKRIPESFDYYALSHLRGEAKEKLSKVRPINLDQASRISGITPADIAQIMVRLEGKGVK